MGASQETRRYRCEFSNSDEFSRFREMVRKNGWSSTAKARINMTPWAKIDVSGKFSQSKKDDEHETGKLEEKTDESCITQILYLPMKSFQLPKSKMCLSADAKADALCVNNPNEAQRFLNTYNSHVSASLYHVGGIFIREETVWSNESKSLNTTVHDSAPSKLEIGGEVSLNALDDGGKDSNGQSKERNSKDSKCVEGQVSKSRSEKRNSEDSFKSNCKVQNTNTWQFGGAPTATDEESFSRSVHDDRSSWVVIDKNEDQPRDLVGVWEIMLQAGDDKLNQPAKLIREVWQDSVREDTLRDDKLEKLLQLSKPASEHCYGPLAPLPPKISPRMLPYKLRDLLQSSEFNRPVETLVKSCLTDIPTESQGVRKVIMNYGFDKEGNMNRNMNGNNLRCMIQDLEQLESGHNTKEKLPYSAWKLKDAAICNLPAASPTFTYNGDIVIDRPFPKAPLDRLKQCQSFINCLRHRLEHRRCFNMPDVQNHTRGKGKSKRNSRADQAPCTGDPDLFHSRLEILIYIMQSSDIPAQIALCKLLLRQRSTAPLVVAKDNPSGVVTFTHYVQALCFVEVKLAQEEVISLTEDTSLPRVVFLSSRNLEKSSSANVASRVCNCDFLSKRQGNVGMGKLATPVVEVGVGFVKERPCLAVNVVGPYKQLLGFVKDIANAIVVELEPTGTTRNLSFPTVLEWENRTENGLEGNKIWGDETHIVDTLADLLDEAFEELLDEAFEDCETSPKVGIPLKDVCLDHFPPKALITFQELQQTLDESDIAIKQSLGLQRSFEVEARMRIELQRKANRATEKKCENEKETRSSLAKEIIQLPILQLFHGMLSQADRASRRVGIMLLETAIKDKMGPVLQEAERIMDQAFEQSQADPNNRNLRASYQCAKRNLVSRKLGLDHLWRELCHIFVAYPTSQRPLAKLAAQHLLDGFPLEILDGDAGRFCKDWVESVLDELSQLISQGEKKKTQNICAQCNGRTE